MKCIAKVVFSATILLQGGCLQPGDVCPDGRARPHVAGGQELGWAGDDTCEQLCATAGA